MATPTTQTTPAVVDSLRPEYYRLGVLGKGAIFWIQKADGTSEQVLIKKPDFPNRKIEVQRADGSSTTVDVTTTEFFQNPYHGLFITKKL